MGIQFCQRVLFHRLLPPFSSFYTLVKHLLNISTRGVFVLTILFRYDAAAAAAAAAAAKSRQLYLTVRPHRRQPTRLLCPWHSPGKNILLYFFSQFSLVAQSCPTLSDPMDCSLPGASIHGIFHARVLEWGAIAFSGCPLWATAKTV